MELSIDTASEMASLALSGEGQLAAEMTWRCRRNHTVELLPTVEKLLAQVGTSKKDLTAVFVCIGPGLYTGLRVGVSTAKGLAYALGLPIVGVGRLQLDAYPHSSYRGPIVPIHTAGRGELAWAVYENDNDNQREVLAPRLSLPDEMLARVPADALFCGEVGTELAQDIAQRLPQASLAPPAVTRRAAYLASVAYRRLVPVGGDDPAALRPVYLRKAVVGPPTAGRQGSS